MELKPKELEFDFYNEDTGYLTHSIHPYPAKFPPQLPKIILEKYSKRNEIVLDPFCGSGTTLVEAKLLGINSIGVDVNGLSCLLSKVKSTPITRVQGESISNFIERISEILFQWKLGNRPKIKIREIEGRDHWFQKNVSEELTFIIDEINLLGDTDVRDFLKIVLSSIIVKVSNQESDTRFASINKKIQDYYTLEQFIIRAREYLKRLIEFSEKSDNNAYTKVFNADSRDLSFIESNSIDLIITSPPYANTYDYYLYHKFRKRWLGLDVHFAQYNEIGSRREYSSLKEKPSKWTNDLNRCFLEMYDVLKHNSLAFIIIGDSVINKNLIKIDVEIKSIAESVGFKLLNIISSDLANHSKIFNPTYAQKGKKEHLIILQKNGNKNLL